MQAIDYEDRFALATGSGASPEEWARAMFGDVPSVGEVLIWRVLLGLRLSRGASPDTVAGWRIGGRGDGWIRLAAASRHLTADLVVRTEPGEVSLTTVLRYADRAGRLIWVPASAVHRRLVPGVLRSAAARVRAADARRRADRLSRVCPGWRRTAARGGGAVGSGGRRPAGGP